MPGDVQPAGAAALLVHLPRGERGVAIDRLEVFGDVAVRVMLQLFAHPADGSVDGERLVDVAARPLRSPSIVEPELVVRVPIRRTNPAPEMPCRTGDVKSS